MKNQKPKNWEEMLAEIEVRNFKAGLKEGYKKAKAELIKEYSWKCSRIVRKQRAEILGEIEKALPDNGLEEYCKKTAKRCEMICDHSPMWDGQHYTCENCGRQFVILKGVLEILKSKLQ